MERGEYRSMSLIFLLLVSLSTLCMAVPSPKEKFKVKYKVKSGVKGERMKVLETSDDLNLQNKSGTEALNIIETGPTIKEASKPIHSTIPDYKDTVKTIMGQLERAARSGDL